MLGIEAAGELAEATWPEVRAALASAADFAPFSTDTCEPEHGVVLFEGVDEPLLARIRELSATGARRLLALQVGEASLSVSDHWSLMQAGAADVRMWRGPASAGALLARLLRWQAVERLLRDKVVIENLCGESPAFRRVLREIVAVARFTDASALLLGESGTGKELVARLIHTLDPRAEKGPLVVLDCTTIVSELSGSEFFGHERGAFTGAVQGRDGAIALADGGSLFLDEIGELPLALQAQLLRVIQERSYKRVGGSQWLQARFRLICATHRDLEREVQAGRFRHDLYHRLTQSVFRLPALRERPQDVLPLARRFLCERLGQPSVEFQEAVQQYLHRRAYPGNVRELRQLAQRIASRHVGGALISVGDLPEDERPECATLEDWRGSEFDSAIRRALCQGVGLKDITQYAADSATRIAMFEEQGNLQRAARRLGVTDRALQLRRAQRSTSQPLMTTSSPVER